MHKYITVYGNIKFAGNSCYHKFIIVMQMANWKRLADITSFALSHQGKMAIHLEFSAPE